MPSSPLNSIQTNLAYQKKLYDKFRKKCQAQNISIKTALREAILLWFHHDMGDKDFTRYIAQEQIRKELVESVRQVLKSKSVAQAGKLLRQILEEY